MAGTEVTIAGPDGGFGGYLARPEGGVGPGVVVIQEVFGVNPVMRGITDSLAAEGFAALCPDLFWRQEPGLQLSDQNETELARAFELFQGFDFPAGVRDVAATLDHLRSEDACTGTVGVVGFCLGGLLAYLAGTRTATDCAVGYYGVGIEQKLDEATNLTKPLMLHIATADEFVPEEAQTAVRGDLGTNPLVTIHEYEGLGHAFARRGGDHYDASAAALANGRTYDFLHANLG
jgi:carboxymethylenebutenolidase